LCRPTVAGRFPAYFQSRDYVVADTVDFVATLTCSEQRWSVEHWTRGIFSSLL